MDDYKLAYERECEFRMLAEKNLVEKTAELSTAMRVTKNTIKEQSALYNQLAEAHNKLKDTQNQLIQSEKMASIGQLSAGVAHEINNPLGFIKSNMETLELYISHFLNILNMYKHADKSLPAKLSEVISAQRKKMDLDYVENDVSILLAESIVGVERIEEIVKDLQLYNRQVPPETRQWVDLHDVIDVAVKMALKKYQGRVEIVKSYGEIPLVKCNNNQMIQVILNILMNGIQATFSCRRKGIVTIQTELKKVTEFSHETTTNTETRRSTDLKVNTGTKTAITTSSVTLSVIDNGEGIDAEAIQKIYEPFYTTKSIGQGTGLGLSVVYNILEQHEFDIQSASSSFEGTRFTITIPVVNGGINANSDY